MTEPYSDQDEINLIALDVILQPLFDVGCGCCASDSPEEALEKVIEGFEKRGLQVARVK